MPKKILSLKKVLDRVHDILKDKDVFNHTFWVKCDLSDLRFKEHYYFELNEIINGLPVAKISAHIWNKQIQIIKNNFRQHNLEFKLENKKQYLMECRLTFHVVHGLSLDVIDVDIEYQMADLERHRQELIKRLHDEKLFEINKLKKLPLIIKRIGLITSADSAAYNDFVKTIKQSMFSFQIIFANAAVQGNQTESSILRALNQINKYKIDLLVIIRGGGAEYHLFDLDKEVIARNIANFKCPVWTGIGHEINLSLLDYVANQHFYVPHGVAKNIIDHNDKLYQKLLNSKEIINNRTNDIFNNVHDILERHNQGIRVGTEKYITLKNNSLTINKSKLRNIQIKISEYSKRINKKSSSLIEKINVFLFNNKSSFSNSVSSFHSKIVNIINHHDSKYKSKKVYLTSKSQEIINAKINLLKHGKELIKIKSNNKFTDSLKSLNSKISMFNSQKFINIINSRKNILQNNMKFINAISPENNIQKGYSLTTDTNGIIISSVKQIEKNQVIKTLISDGLILSNITEVNKNGTKIF